MKIVSFFLAILTVTLPVTGWAAAKPIPNPPALDATSYYLVDFDSGQVLAEKDPDKHIEPAR